VLPLVHERRNWTYLAFAAALLERLLRTSDGGPLLAAVALPLTALVTAHVTWRKIFAALNVLFFLVFWGDIVSPRTLLHRSATAAAP
jgi:hypothetical protein